MKEVEKKKLLIGLVAIVVVVLLVGVIIFYKSGNNSTGSISRETQLLLTSTPTPTPKLSDTVMVTSHGFVPQSLQVKKGTFVNFANFSEEVIDVVFDANPDKSMTVGKIEVGDTNEPKQYNEIGEYDYHNANKIDEKGKIFVEDR